MASQGKEGPGARPRQETLLAPVAEGASRPQGAEMISDGMKSHLKIDKTIRIAVTGDVFITKLEREIIDSPDFQRLRGVRQLGNVLHVYPTALHTRFDHALGTLAIADKMVKAIQNNTGSEEGSQRDIDSTQEILVRLYALLHDLTHVPFGHTIEDEFHIFDRHDDNPERILRFLGPESGIGKIIRRLLGESVYGRLIRVYLWEEDEERRKRRSNDPRWENLKQWLDIVEDDVFVHDLVSNTVCADLLDYLARDNYFCNLAVSLEYRFINFLYLHRPKGNNTKRRVFVRLWKGRQKTARRDTLTDLSRLLETRYIIAERAYFHHAKIISGTMLGRAVYEYKTAGHLKEEDLYAHTDDTLVHELSRSEIPTVSSLATDLQSRRLYKIAHSFVEKDFSSAQRRSRDVNLLENALAKLKDPHSRTYFENTLAAYAGLDPGQVLIYAPPKKMNNKVARMSVIWDGEEKLFCEINDPIIEPRLNEILKAHEMLWAISIIVKRGSTTDVERLLIDSFKAEFLSPVDEQAGERQRLFEIIIDNELDSQRYAGEMNVNQYKQQRRKAAEALQLVAKKDTSGLDFRADLKKVLRQYFPDAPGASKG